MAVFPLSEVFARVAIVSLLTTTTTMIPVMSWVVRQHSLQTPHVIRKHYMIHNLRRFRALSSDPCARSKRCRECAPRLTTITSRRLHTSHDREKRDETDQTPSSSSSTVPSLTSEMLSLRFRDVFAHFRSLQQTPSGEDNEPIMNVPDESTIRLNLLRTRHPNLELNKCRIDISTVPDAGYGVYATEQLYKNELITLYPGDALIQWKHKDHLDPNTHGGIQIFFGTHIPPAERSTAALDNTTPHPSDATIDNNKINSNFMNHIPTARNYEVRINDTISVIGDPHRNADPAYLGHMINDYCTIPSTTIRDDEAEAIRQYNIPSIQQSNCQIKIGTDRCHVEIVATRDVALGDELFLSYGTSYWLSRCAATTKGAISSSSSIASPMEDGTTKRTKEPTVVMSKPGFGKPNSKRK
jgi:SET domain